MMYDSQWAAPQPQTPADGVVDVRYVVGAVWRSGWIVALLAVGGAAGMIALAQRSEPLFSSTSKVLIEPRNWQIGTVDLADTAVRYNENLIRSKVEIILSNNVMLPVVQDLKLAEYSYFTTTSGEVIGDIPDLPDRLALRTLHQSVSVAQSGLSDVIAIEATAPSPTLAADIANAIAESYVEVEAASRSAQLDETAQWLSGRMAELESAVLHSANELEAYRARNSGVTDARFAELSREVERLRDTAASLSGAGRDRALQQMQQTESRLAEMGQVRVTLGELERQANADRGLYEQFLERSKMLQEAEDLRLSDSRVIDRAIPPLVNSSPNTSLMAIAGLFLGGILGLMAALVYGLFLRPLRRVADVEYALGQPAMTRLRRRRVAPVTDPAALTADHRPLELATADAGPAMIAGLGGRNAAVGVVSGLAQSAAATGQRAVIVDCSAGRGFLADAQLKASGTASDGQPLPLHPLGFDLLTLNDGAAGTIAQRVQALGQDYDLVLLYADDATRPLPRAVIQALNPVVVPVLSLGGISIRRARRAMTRLRQISDRLTGAVVAGR